MALSEFEIAIGGITAIPVVGGLIFLGYKSFGESSLDTGKLKPIQKPAVAKEAPTPDKKMPKMNNQKPERNNNITAATKEKTSPSEQPKAAKEKFEMFLGAVISPHIESLLVGSMQPCQSPDMPKAPQEKFERFWGGATSTY